MITVVHYPSGKKELREKQRLSVERSALPFDLIVHLIIQSAHVFHLFYTARHKIVVPDHDLSY